MIIRIFFALLAIWVALRLLRRWQRKKQSAAPRSVAVPDKMVQCERCGLYLPLDEAYVQGERYYCCKTHGRGADRTGA